MFLTLNHQKLHAYTLARQFVQACYTAVNCFPSDEKYVLALQIKRAALSVHLNIAEGSSRKSGIERRRFYEIARGSIIEVDAAFDVAADLKYCTSESLQILGAIMIDCFKVLSGLINSASIHTDVLQ